MPSLHSQEPNPPKGGLVTPLTRATIGCLTATHFPRMHRGKQEITNFLLGDHTGRPFIIVFSAIT